MHHKFNFLYAYIIIANIVNIWSFVQRFVSFHSNHLSFLWFFCFVRKCKIEYEFCNDESCISLCTFYNGGKEYNWRIEWNEIAKFRIKFMNILRTKKGIMLQKCKIPSIDNVKFSTITIHTIHKTSFVVLLCVVPFNFTKQV